MEHFCHHHLFFHGKKNIKENKQNYKAEKGELEKY